MLELPEAITIAKQLNKHLAGKRIRRVLPPTKVHKFCWYAGDPAEYDARMSGSTVLSAEGFGSYVEVTFDHGKRLCFNDGVNARLIDCTGAPKNHQLLIGSLWLCMAALSFMTVLMITNIISRASQPFPPFPINLNPISAKG